MLLELHLTPPFILGFYPSFSVWAETTRGRDGSDDTNTKYEAFTILFFIRTDIRPGNKITHCISFSGANQAQKVKSQHGSYCNRDTRCQPTRGSQADMRKIATKLRFPSRDQGIYAPLVHGTPSCSYSTMSHPAPTPAPEPVSPGARKDDMDSFDSPVVSPRTYDEPIVTRKELWSYYRKSCSSSHFPGLQQFVIPSILQWRQRALIIMLSVRTMLRFRCLWVVSRVLGPSVSFSQHIFRKAVKVKDINAPKVTP